VPQLDYHWIVPGIAQGAYPDPPKSAFQVFDVIVFCAEELQPRIKAPAGKQIFKLPLDDDIYRPIPPEIGKLLHQAAQALATYHAGGHKLLITCAQGVNRSGLMTGLTMMYSLRMPARETIKLIRSKRKSQDPDLFALCNPMFEQYLYATSPVG
jgi:protein-tyrosine phosphatase